jgi:hypothetical protein
MIPTTNGDPQQPNLVGPADGCPGCGERDADSLIWTDDDTVECAACGRRYTPGGGEA